MDSPRRILHLLAEPENLDLLSQVEHLVGHQIGNGAFVRVVMLGIDSEIAQSLADRGVSVQVVPNRWQFDPFVAVRSSGELRSWRPNVLHLWGNSAVGFARAARWMDSRVHILATLSRPPCRNGWRLWQPHSHIEKLMVDSQYAAMRCLGQDLDAKQVQVIHPGVPAGEHPPDAASRLDTLQWLSLSADARLIAVGGLLTREQGIDEAIWCFEMVRTLHEQARLIVLGTGPQRAQLERYARLVSEPQAIRFVADRAQFNRVLASSDVYWQTNAVNRVSTWMLSAMAAGVPVVASDSVVVREILDPGTDVLLVPGGTRADLARQTDRVLSDQELAGRLAETGRQVVTERFSVEQMCLAYDEAYQSLGQEAAHTPAAR